MRYKWTLLAMLWCVVFFNYADRQALAAVVPLLRSSWHLTPVEEGKTSSGLHPKLDAAAAQVARAASIPA